MKKTKIITLGILAMTAMACDDKSEMQHCVNQDGVVVEEALCQPDAVAPDVETTIVDDAGIITHQSMHIYRWHYGNYYHPFIIGSRVSGGSYIPSEGHSYTTPSTFSKGGFGATGEGMAHIGVEGAGE